MSTRIPASHVMLKRAYDPPGSGDGTRVLVDRLWPRGVRKDEAAIDLWLKDLAPSTELRMWFAHDTARWPEFQNRYADEVHQQPKFYGQLRDLARNGPVTLVYASYNQKCNNAVVLRKLLLGRGRPGG